MNEVEINTYSPLTVKRILLTVVSMMLLLLSPFALTDVVTYLTGCEVFGSVLGGGWAATLLCGAYLDWDVSLKNYLKAKLGK